MAKKITAADIDNFKGRNDFIEFLKKYNFDIPDTDYERLSILKEKAKEKLDFINSQLEKNTSSKENNAKNNQSSEKTKEEKQSQNDNSEEEIKLKNLKILETEDIDISNLVLYRNSDLTKVNNFIIESSIDLLPVVCLKNEKGEVAGKLFIKDEDGKKYIVSEKENIAFDKLEKSDYCEIIIVDKNEKTVGYSLKTPIEIKDLKLFNGTLCIDLGTSNTALGTYFPDLPENEAIKLVKFVDVLDGNIEKETIPTVIYIEDCSDANNIIYKFGYEAKKTIKEKDYNFKNTIFYEIKKWLLNIEQEEEITDGNLNKVTIKRKDMLKAYLEYLLKEASNQFQYKFKKLHFSTPITLKNKYISSLKKILDNYEIMDSDESIDEGVAVIYDEIYSDISELDSSDEEITSDDKAMTIDIGGGTTDVVSSTYSLTNEEAGTKLIINTYPENSNSHFGGNNITYRIFQYLKIKIAKYLEDEQIAEKIDIDKLIPESKADILENIDKEKSTEKIYKTFEEEYKKASEILPTNFKSNTNFITNKNKNLLKRNFYLLWEAAEIIKVEFFKKTEIYLITFDDEDKESKIIKIPNLDNLLFSIVKNNSLETIQKVPQISIGINEIQKLIYGDIYKLLKDILEDKEDIINDYRKVKLSGQTCNITLFQELLKEFIAGKYLRKYSSSSSNSNSSYAKLKLNCIRGSIRYTADIDKGITIPEIYKEKAPLKNTVTINRLNEEVVLSKEKSIIQLFEEKATTLQMKIYDWENKFIKTEVYNLSSEKEGRIYRDSDIENKMSDYYEQVDEQLRKISSPEIRVVLFAPNRNADGFDIIELYKTSNNEFKFINKKSFSFEKNIDTSNFFNGEV